MKLLIVIKESVIVDVFHSFLVWWNTHYIVNTEMGQKILACFFFVVLEKNFLLFYFIIAWRTLRSMFSNTDLCISAPTLSPHRSGRKGNREVVVYLLSITYMWPKMKLLRVVKKSVIIFNALIERTPVFRLVLSVGCLDLHWTVCI